MTAEDVDELKACLELGFGFKSPEAELDSRLSDTLPALGLFHNVNKSYSQSISKSGTATSFSSPDRDFFNSPSPSPSPLGSPLAVLASSGIPSISYIYSFFFYIVKLFKILPNFGVNFNSFLKF